MVALANVAERRLDALGGGFLLARARGLRQHDQMRGVEAELGLEQRRPARRATGDAASRNSSSPDTPSTTSAYRWPAAERARVRLATARLTAATTAAAETARHRAARSCAGPGGAGHVDPAQRGKQQILRARERRRLLQRERAPAAWPRRCRPSFSRASATSACASAAVGRSESPAPPGIRRARAHSLPSRAAACRARRASAASNGSRSATSRSAKSSSSVAWPRRPASPARAPRRHWRGRTSSSARSSLRAPVSGRSALMAISASSACGLPSPVAIGASAAARSSGACGAGEVAGLEQRLAVAPAG